MDNFFMHLSFSNRLVLKIYNNLMSKKHLNDCKKIRLHCEPAHNLVIKRHKDI